MLKIGVLGAGHLGKIHLKLLKEINDFELVGFYDADPFNTKTVSENLLITGYPTVEELISKVDVVDIVTPTLTHFECAQKSLRQFRHIFIEKPITNTTEEARSIINLAKEANVKGQVGHVERFNPAFKAAVPYFEKPMFIECHRLAQWNPRGTDVSVVLDLMIHDLDIILSVVKSNIKRISASGVAVVSESPDICNARIEFDNGCVANLTASRISLKNMRKTRFFQRNAYISVDFLEKKTEVVRMKDIEGEPGPYDIMVDMGAGKNKKLIFFDNPAVEPSNAIKEELTSFALAIKNDSVPLVSLSDGYAALDVAYQIIEKMQGTSGIS